MQASESRRQFDAGVALARRYFLDARVRTIAFAYLFAVYSYVQPAGYHSTYPSVADRVAFARSFAGNDALRLFYGYPYDVLSIGGYTAWRVGGTLALLVAVFGLLAGIRALRTEEEAGRTELILASSVGRQTLFIASMAAIGAGLVVLFVGQLVGCVVAGLPAAGSAYLALCTVSVGPVFVGIGALASQLAPTRRVAVTLGTGTLVLFWLVRVVADTAQGASALRWLSPFGWAELMRPFTGGAPAVLVLALVAWAPLVALAFRWSKSRDIGTGLLQVRDVADPRLRLLSSPAALTLRSEIPSLVAWSVGVAALAVVFGMISSSVSTAGISDSIRKQMAKLGAGSIATPTGYLAFVFIIFILAICLFVCAEIGGVRHDEAADRLETLLALPVSRSRFLGARMLIVMTGASGLSLLGGTLVWAGARSQGVHVPYGRMVEAGVNCLPTAALFLGLSTLAFALIPRASVGVSYGLTVTAFLWYLVGSLLGLPKWIEQLTPFQHIGLVPVQPFRAGSAAVMVAIGMVAGGAGLVVFRRRDLVGA